MAYRSTTALLTLLLVPLVIAAQSDGEPPGEITAEHEQPNAQGSLPMSYMHEGKQRVLVAVWRGRGSNRNRGIRTARWGMKCE